MLFTTPFLTVYILVLTAVTGLVMGSFLNCLAWRTAHGESVLRGRSHCAVCNAQLSAAELVPLFSFIFLRGKCRHCGVKISPRYPAVEALTAVIYLSTVLRFDLTLSTAKYLILLTILLTAALVDLDVFLIPDRFIVAGIVNFLVFALVDFKNFLPTLKSGLIGAFAVAGALLVVVLLADKVLKKETMGGADIKLVFMLGLYLGWKLNIMLLMFACVFGIVFVLVSMLVSASREAETDKKADSASPASDASEDTESGFEGIPFGPSIALAAWVVVLFGEPVLEKYLSLF